MIRVSFRSTHNLTILFIHTHTVVKMWSRSTERERDERFSGIKNVTRETETGSFSKMAGLFD